MAYVNQIGNDNKAHTELTGGVDNNWTYTRQNGNSNIGYVQAKGDGNMISLYQYGDENEAGEDPWYADPDGDNIHNVGILVEGNNNIAQEYQNGYKNKATYAVYGYSNMFYGTQVGDENTYKIDQYNWKDVENYQNFVTVYQQGNLNEAYGKLKGDMNNIHFYQYGDENMIEGLTTPELMFEGDNSQVIISQYGTENTARGEIHNMSGDVNVYQSGMNNLTEVHIGNSLLWHNMVDVDQMGADNYTNVQQTTNGNHATVYQNGNSNSSTVIQH
jgi:hypothetical protein